MSSRSQEVSLLLEQHRQGQPEAFGKLLALVYDELRRLAAYQLQSERANHTLQPTALVHEAFLRIAGPGQELQWRDKSHFFALAAQVMRHVLVDYARAHRTEKRGQGRQNIPLEELRELPAETAPDLLALDEALSTLAAKDERKSRIVELRYFGGLSIEETAGVLGLSATTVRREWTMTKAWLRHEMKSLDEK
ncbi:MAG TPA: ECF-type sigma factor [Pyrinomonadaceae bacterium]